MTEWLAESGAKATPIISIEAAAREAMLIDAPPAVKAFADAAGFKGKAGETLLIPTSAGKLKTVLFGLGDGKDPFVYGALPQSLPEGDYVLDPQPEDFDPTLVALGWGLGAYVFDRYKSSPRSPAKLVAPEGCDVAEAGRLARAAYLVRDLVNTPAADMGPRQMEAAADRFIDDYGANVRVTVDKSLEQYGYPMVYAVGKAGADEPRVIELEWGEDDHPVICVVGKGVTFDTGGLNIKVGDYMRLMKKDMGGAAHALGLAQLIMEAELPCKLHVILPIAENAISSNAFRPGDVLKSRTGKTVEIENTDAEGRLILADALARAAEHNPRVIIDFATLTGAARVALGPELAPFYATDDAHAQSLEASGRTLADPVWRMPLWDGYDRQLDSPIADLRNLGDGPFAGSVVAALFLRRFTGGKPWVHFDVFAWNPSARPGRPKGGEAQGLRAAYGFVQTLLSA